MFVGKSSLMKWSNNFLAVLLRSINIGDKLIPPGNDWNHYSEYINPYTVDEFINKIRNPMGMDRPHLEKIPSPSICLLTTPLKTNWYPKWRHVWMPFGYIFQGYHHFWVSVRQNFGGVFNSLNSSFHHRLRRRSSVESSNWTDNPPRGWDGRRPFVPGGKTPNWWLV